jgi:hypothetical protein
MMCGNEEKNQRISSGIPQKERIDTQIHRRRKVKAFSPLESEWESSQAGPSSREVRHEEKENKPLMPHREFAEESSRSA